MCCGPRSGGVGWNHHRIKKDRAQSVLLIVMGLPLAIAAPAYTLRRRALDIARQLAYNVGVTASGMGGAPHF